MTDPGAARTFVRRFRATAEESSAAVVVIAWLQKVLENEHGGLGGGLDNPHHPTTHAYHQTITIDPAATFNIFEALMTCVGLFAGYTDCEHVSNSPTSSLRPLNGGVISYSRQNVIYQFYQLTFLP